MTPEEMRQAVAQGTVFGRVAPQQKEQMVQLLCSQGKYVAMIGDSVNDVLALKQADLAITPQGGGHHSDGGFIRGAAPGGA